MFKVPQKSKTLYNYTSTLMTHRLEKADCVLDWYRGYYVRFTHLSLRIRRTDSRKVRGSIPRLSTVFFCNSAFDEYCFYLYVYFRLLLLFASALFSHSSIFCRQSTNQVSVFFVRWFRAPFFEQVVFALGVLEVTSAGDIEPLVQRRFRLFA